MNVLVFGAAGMVGQAVLRECLLDAGVAVVTAVGRTPLLQSSIRKQIEHGDMFDLSSIASRLRGHDACFFCLGMSSVGMTEPNYRRLTHDLTLAVAGSLALGNPAMSFSYVSGAGTDSSEAGESMWARIKGKTGNDLLQAGFSRVFLFRPGVIQPLHGVRTKSHLYRLVYAVLGPLISLAKRLLPRHIVTSEELGRAMLATARHLQASAVLEVEDIVMWDKSHS